MKETMVRSVDEKSIGAENIRARSRLVRNALILGISIVLVAALCFIVASHLGFEHMACKMAEDALGSALSHAHSLVRAVDPPH